MSSLVEKIVYIQQDLYVLDNRNLTLTIPRAYNKWWRFLIELESILEQDVLPEVKCGNNIAYNTIKERIEFIDVSTFVPSDNAHYDIEPTLRAHNVSLKDKIQLLREFPKLFRRH